MGEGFGRNRRAILSHGGEAQLSRDRFVAATREQRAAVIAFLESL